MSNYPIENKFRPPVEFVSAAASLSVAGILFYSPSWLIMPPKIALWMVLGCLILFVVRAIEGYRIVKFHSNLKRLPKFILKPEEVPVSNKYLYLGQGFQWDARHTMRLRQVRTPAISDKYLKPNWLHRQVRQFVLDHEDSPVTAFLNKDKWAALNNPFAPPAPVGGDAEIHGIEPDEAAVLMALDERHGHTLVEGTTRVGKTRLAEVMICQDIRRGDVVIVFDPKGDVDLLMRMYAEAVRAGRENDFYFFHLGYPDKSARYNSLGSFTRITEVASRTAGPLPSEGQSATFRQFVWLFVNVMARALNALGRKPTFELIYQNATNIDALAEDYFTFWLDRDHPEWRQEFENHSDDEDLRKELSKTAQKTQHKLDLLLVVHYIQSKGWLDPVAVALVGLVAKERSYFEKLVASLYPFLEKLTTGAIAELISPKYEDLNDPRPIFTWADVINNNKIIYIGLDSLTDPEVGGAIGTTMFADLTSTAGLIYKAGAGVGQSIQSGKKRVCVHADEFNELIGDEFIPLLNKAGGAGFQVTVYTQTWDDVEAKIGNRAKAGQIGGNLNNLIMLRVLEAKTAEILTKRLPEVSLFDVTPDSAVSDTNDPLDFADFSSRNADKLGQVRVPMLTTADILKLPKGQCFALFGGGQLYKIRLPLFDTTDDKAMLPGLDAVVKDMRAKYNNYVEQTNLLIEGKGSGF